MATEFLNAFAAGDHAEAARMTDDPQAARRLLDRTRRQLSPEKITASVTEVTGGEGSEPTTVGFDISWAFGKGKVWSYRGELELVRTEQGLQVHWDPSVIHPELSARQTLDFDVQQATPAPVLGRNGVRLMAPQKLVRVSVVPGAVDNVAQVAASLAQGLSEVAPAITPQSIRQGVEATPDKQAHTVVRLRWADYQAVKERIYELPGVRFPTETVLIATEQGYASQVLPSIKKQLEDRLNGKDGWRVLTRNAAGVPVQVLHKVEPKPAEALTTTLSDRIQSAAEKAVDKVSNAAMIVAIRPSDGDIMAVAQNAPADSKGALALTGRYPPGSTFKTVTALAAIQRGLVDIDTPVACPAKKTFNGKTLPNAHNFSLGTVPLRTAFAESCNTTFAQLAADMPPRALSEAAKQLGLGANFVVPGITTITGDVPAAEKVVQRAVNGIGQGTVLASPFGMALVAASVAKGSMPVPGLVEGMETKTKSEIPPPPEQRAIEQVRAMMREVVESGTATELAGMGGVAGKTGTAQFGDGTQAHGWFIGFRDDLAFAVLVTDAGTSDRAVAVARDFLANTR